MLSLDNCTFKEIHGYGIGDNVLNVGNGMVLINGERVNGLKGVVTYVENA